jgi:hypothetical protein
MVAKTPKLPLFPDIWEIFTWLGSWIIPLFIIGLCAFFATLSVTVRRCNDIGMNPFWSLLIFVPYVGFGAMLLFGILGSDDTTPQSKDTRKKLNSDADEEELKTLLNMKSSTTTPNKNFLGEKSLGNDSYKLFLSKKYGINKNEVFEKYVSQEKLFDSIEEALKFVNDIEVRLDKELAEEKEILRLKEAAKKIEEKQLNENWNRQLEAEAKLRQEKWVAGEPRRKAVAKKRRIYIYLIALLLVLSAIGGWKFYEHKTSYLVFREAVKNEGWLPLNRPSPIAGWTKPFPEVFYCDEGYCFAGFVNKSKPKLVRTISYEYCGHPYGGKCLILNAEGFLRTSSDELISRKKSDENYESIRKHMEN